MSEANRDVWAATLSANQWRNSMRLGGATQCDWVAHTVQLRTNDVNFSFPKDPSGKWDVPIMPNTKVITATTNHETKWVRFFSDDSRQTGAWVMPENEVRGLTPKQIQEKYALDSPPTKMADVTLPAGVRLEISTAGPQKNFGMSGGGTQIRIDIPKPEINESWFSNPRSIK